MAEPTPAPDCPPCDHCCKACCTDDCSCDSPFCEYAIVFVPDDLPDLPYLDCCGPKVQMEDVNTNCSSVGIQACCNGIDGCDNKSCKSILWRVCNKTERCIEVQTTFKITNLKKGSEPLVNCPDEDVDCCALQYRGSFESECKWNEPGTVFEPNGIAPGPGFCMAPCSEQTICVNARVGLPDGECGCKKYSDSAASDSDCCEAIAKLIYPCATLCCADNYPALEQGCESGCSESLAMQEPTVVCEPCCGCCQPDQSLMEFDGWTIVSAPTNCCTDLVVKLTDTMYWDCCTLGDCTLDTPPNDICEPITGFLDFYHCDDPHNTECFCVFEPVPIFHSHYIAPCVCSPGNMDNACFGSPDDCGYGAAYVFQGTENGFSPSECCYEQDLEATTEDCLVSPCSFSDTPNSACLQ